LLGTCDLQSRLRAARRSRPPRQTPGIRQRRPKIVGYAGATDRLIFRCAGSRIANLGLQLGGRFATAAARVLNETGGVRLFGWVISDLI
jgi:hypothetical protein